MAWNPRYVAYARANGRTPTAQRAHDKREYPGGCMLGFVLWISEQYTAFIAAHKHEPDVSVGGEWDAWLNREEVLDGSQPDLFTGAA